MTINESWEKAQGWIYYWFKKYKPKILELEDYYQECALYFWGKLAKKYNAMECWCYSKKAFARIIIKMLYRTPWCKIKTCSLHSVKDLLLSNCNYFDYLGFSVKLRRTEREVADLIIAGYETKEIVKITGRTFDAIYSNVRDIKKKYAKEYNIKDYQRKHLRKFTRNKTEKEVMSWKQSKDRLKAVQELKKREKYLQTQEKSVQCVI